jgi:hypothetical protein
MARRQSLQTIAWFRDLYTRGLLDLDPPYQRRSVWNQAYKDYFIDTLLLQYPAPALFIYEQISPEGASSFSVVDGKQRLMTIFDFTEGLFPVFDEAAVARFRGNYFQDLEDDDRTAFWTYQFSVEYLPTNNESVLNDIFDRINRNVAKLTRQELRHAQFSGKFITAAEDLAEWMVTELGSDVPRISETARRQMRDVELVAQLLLMIEDGPQAYSQDALDTVTALKDTDWDAEEPVREVFQAVVELLKPVAAGMAGANPRLRNQADFYSCFGTLAALVQRDEVPQPGDITQRLNAFFEVVNDDAAREADARARRYYEAARSNSNGLAERTARNEILIEVLTE